MSPGELPELVSRRPQRSKDFARLIEFYDPIEATIDHPDMLVWCDMQPIRIADPHPLGQKAALGIAAYVRTPPMTSYVFGELTDPI